MLITLIFSAVFISIIMRLVIFIGRIISHGHYGHSHPDRFDGYYGRSRHHRFAGASSRAWPPPL
jgi:hypothetical protein